MTFLHPLLLAGLALTALPIIIHLINQWRYRTIRWGAMMFLLRANRMARGLARLRQWLILLMRMLAIACLVFVVSRPLASGWLGWLTTGHADTTILLLDRSPSMSETSGGRSKLAAARRQLAETLGRFPSTRWVLIESAAPRPRELESPAALAQLPETGPTSAAADLPAMLAAARDYITANQAGRCEIWICSDLREADWNADDARWSKLRSSFAGLPQPVRFHLLAYAQPPQGNLAVRVTALRRRKLGEEAELLVSLRLSRAASGDALSVPVQFDLGGARSTLNVELSGTSVEVREHRLPLDRQHLRGWGRVSIPADANAADNDYYFAYDAAQPIRVAIVSDDVDAARPLRLMAEISPDIHDARSVEMVAVEKAAAIEFNETALVLWQAALPAGDMARRLVDLVDRGGQVIFFPPRQPAGDEVFGVRWAVWSPVKEGAVIDRWRGDEDLLANTQSGLSLPLGRLSVKNVCSLTGETTPLAALEGGAPLLVRAETPRGGVYFCATTPAARDSNLAGEGVVLYAAIQRALAAGAEAIGNARQVTAGERASDEAAGWRRLAGDASTLSSENAVQAGAYAAGEAILAVNRPAAEDRADVLSGERVSALFDGLDFTRIDQVASRERSLVEELWRPFLMAMLAALLLEAWLSLPVASIGRPASDAVHGHV
ncbi:MAG TPA: BatA domain-containing protein [Pirellulales bacterium]